MREDDPRHGENKGYIAHFLGPEADRKPCEACTKAHAKYRRELWRRRYALKVKSMYVDTIGVRRRGHALNYMGWTYADWAREAGYEGNFPAKYIHNTINSKKMSVYKHAALAGAYDRLCMKLGPSDYVRKLAMTRRYPPPLAWDDIDDPDEHPQGLKHPSNSKKRKFHYATEDGK